MEERIGYIIGVFVSYMLFIAIIFIPIKLILLGLEKMNKIPKIRLKSSIRKPVFCAIPIIVLAFSAMVPVPKSEETTNNTTTTTTTTTVETYEVDDSKCDIDIKDIKIEFTKKGSAIITNNTKYVLTDVLFIYKENDYMIGTNNLSLAKGESYTTSARNYVRDGGYTLKEVQVSYIGDNGKEQFHSYDYVTNRWEY